MMRRYQYELVGGHPVLDFLNTIHDWTASTPVERLNDFQDGLGFGVAAGVLRASEARALEGAPHQQAALTRLHDLRAALASVFADLAAGKQVQRRALDRISRDASRAAAVSVLRRTPTAIERVIDVERAGADVLRLRLADAAVALLTSSALARLKTCPHCGWFFLDSSKNRSRRWCSMQMCGAPAKSRAYYYRQKERQ